MDAVASSLRPTAADDRGLRSRALPSPVGTLLLVASRGGLAAVLWPDDEPERVPLAPIAPQGANDGADRVLDAAAAQLDSYFARRLHTFDLPLDLRGTPFQTQVWQALRAIPYGETRTYRDIADAVGRPKATRAVGAANGRNPVSIIVPCHRVVGANGTLTGFAGGLDVKERLLALEGSRLF